MRYHRQDRARSTARHAGTLVVFCGLLATTGLAQILPTSLDPTPNGLNRHFVPVYTTAPGTGILVFTVFAENSSTHLDRQALLKMVNLENQAATWHTTEDPRPRALQLRRFLLPWATPRVAFDPSLYEVKQRFYASKDGTRIPMFLSFRKGMMLDGSNPVFLHGYGGFNVGISPDYVRSWATFINRGGILADAGIRGGDEYGERWHDAAKFGNKQNTFDDFVAAAEWLGREKYTTRDRLMVGGGSNGGLLIGACLNQRPDLFGAALPAVGVMDMLRFHKFTIGWVLLSD